MRFEIFIIQDKISAFLQRILNVEPESNTQLPETLNALSEPQTEFGTIQKL